jgi:hypothetical protein
MNERVLFGGIELWDDRFPEVLEFHFGVHELRHVLFESFSTEGNLCRIGVVTSRRANKSVGPGRRCGVEHWTSRVRALSRISKRVARGLVMPRSGVRDRLCIDRDPTKGCIVSSRCAPAYRRSGFRRWSAGIFHDGRHRCYDWWYHSNRGSQCWIGTFFRRSWRCTRGTAAAGNRSARWLGDVHIRE